MLSILIPTHDYTCYKLVYDLHEQAEALGVPYEIIVAEDGSRDQVSMIANHKIVDMSNCMHVVRKENKGQATTRNELAEMAKYDWILFIDSDAVVQKGDFVETYIKYIRDDERDDEKIPVVIGGLRHPAVNYNPNLSLRFKYESEADKRRRAELRQQHPYAQMTCFNMLIRKKTFLSILFDKNCREYGYEDALFGVELKKRNIRVLHMENPLIHNGLDTNERFVAKSETALRTLKSLNGRMEGHSALENTYMKLKKLHLVWAMKLFHTVFGCAIRHNLMSPNPSLTLFSIYKLGYYSCLK